MADDETIEELGFDPTMKKKKKKKKKVVALDTEGTSTEPAPAATDAPAEAPAEDTAAPTPAAEDPGLVADLMMDELSFGGKKKKKKKKTAPVPEMAEGEASGLPEDPEDSEFSLSEFTLPNKKKKKKKKVAIDTDAGEGEGGDANGEVTKQKAAWADSDRDYTFHELLERVFDIMRAKNPELVTGEKRRFKMKPPQVVRVGAKKSAFVNFIEICKMLHRQPDHLLGFLFSELGTSGSVDGSNSLIIKGKFQQKQIENVLRRYIREYVTCHTCKSPDTILAKENRLFFLQCQTCGSKCSVASIKLGYQAVTGRRARMRAKTGA